MGDGEPVHIEEAAAPDADVTSAIAGLLPQLSSSAAAPTAEQLAEIIGSPCTTLLVARGREGMILGSLTLAVFRVPTGMRAWIEDVVVDQGARGRGVASSLVTAALTKAASQGARTVELTSRPERTEANRLYRQLGFVPRSTNVYRFELSPPGPESQ